MTLPHHATIVAVFETRLVWSLEDQTCLPPSCSSHPLGSQFCPNATLLIQFNSIRFLWAQVCARSELRRVRGDAVAGPRCDLLRANPGLGPRIQIGTRHCPWKLEVKVIEGYRPRQGWHGRLGDRVGMQKEPNPVRVRNSRWASWYGNASAGLDSS